MGINGLGLPEPNSSGSGGGGGDGAIVDGVSSSIKATVQDLTNSNPLNVAIVDTNGDQIASFGGGIQYVEGDTDASITGTAALMEVGSDTLQPIQGTVADGLLVNLGSNNDVSVSGSVTANAGTDLNTSALALESGGNLDIISGKDFSTETTLASLNAKVTAVDTGAVVVSSSALPSGAATSTKQSDGSQKTQVVDGSGNVIGATSNALDVNIKSGNPTTIAVTNAGTFVVQENGAALTSLQLIDDTVFVDDTATHSTGATKGLGIMAVATPTDGSVDANDIGMVAMTTARQLKVDASGVAVPITDNSVSLTVDAPVGTPVFVRLSDGSSAIATLPVSLASVPSHAVTNAGTFAVQVDGAALTSLQLADDVVYTDDTSTHSTGSSKGTGIMAVATPTDAAVDANDIGMVAMTTSRQLKVDASGVAVPVTDNSSSLSVDWNGTQPVTGSGNATGALRVEIANNGTGLCTVNPGTAANWGVYVEDAGETAGGNLSMAGSVRRDTAASSAGTTGDNATVNTSAEGAMWSVLTPTTTSGLSTFMASGSDGSSILVATKQTIKASAGNLYGYYAYNPETAVTFVHFYNTDTVTVGTTNPQMTIAIPAGSAANLSLPYGINFSTAISCSATTTAGGNGAPATGVSLVAWYK